MEDQAQLTLPVGERDHIQGAAAARVTLVEYGDYQCPHCGAAYPVVQAIQKQLGKKLRFVFRNFPINSAHPQAELAAEAAEAAGARGRFWEMHDATYENQAKLSEPMLLDMAKKLNLDMERFTEELTNGTYRKRVKEDFMSGVRSGVNGTPAFFVDGYRFEGSWDFQTLLMAVEAVLKG
jgi:protein-disulfide isomerase